MCIDTSRPFRVLIVTEDRLTLRLTEACVMAQGAEVLTAESADEAKRVLRSPIGSMPC